MGGSKAPSKSQAQIEAEQLQLEQLKKEQEAMEKAEKEKEALAKAKRGASFGSLMNAEETGTKSGYNSLLG
jgi:hypothetical protein